MVDMTSTIKAKSDQLNAGDLIAGPVVVKVIKVDVRNGDQPISIHTDGGLQPYKPCLSMRRVLGKLWTGETDNWLGKSMVLFNDPEVIWAGKAEGGIRISHLEGLDGIKEVTVRKNKRGTMTYNIEPLVLESPTESRKGEEDYDGNRESIISIEQIAILMRLATVDNNGVTEWTPVACDVMTENNIPNIDQLPASKFELVKKQLSANLV